MVNIRPDDEYLIRFLLFTVAINLCFISGVQGDVEASNLLPDSSKQYSASFQKEFNTYVWHLEFAYKKHVTIGLDVFLLTILLLFSAAFIAVVTQTLKAARANPVESLRYE